MYAPKADPSMRAPAAGGRSSWSRWWCAGGICAAVVIIAAVVLGLIFGLPGAGGGGESDKDGGSGAQSEYVVSVSGATVLGGVSASVFGSSPALQTAFKRAVAASTGSSEDDVTITDYSDTSRRRRAASAGRRLDPVGGVSVDYEVEMTFDSEEEAAQQQDELETTMSDEDSFAEVVQESLQEVFEEDPDLVEDIETETSLSSTDLTSITVADDTTKSNEVVVQEKPSPTPSPSRTPSPTPSQSRSPTPSRSPSPGSASQSPAASPSAPPSPTPSSTSTPTATPSVTPSNLPHIRVVDVNGRDAHEGRVEVFHEGEWRSVCSENWGVEEAKVVCRELGFEGMAEAILSTKDSLGKTPRAPEQDLNAYWLTQVDCTGKEASLNLCLHRPWGRRSADDDNGSDDDSYTCRDLGAVRCLVDHSRAHDGDLRLVGAFSAPAETMGLLQLFHDHEWRSVYPYGDFGSEEAQVACRQLGLSAHGAELISQSNTNGWIGYGRTYWIGTNVHCVGNETRLLDCPMEDPEALEYNNDNMESGVVLMCSPADPDHQGPPSGGGGGGEGGGDAGAPPPPPPVALRSVFPFGFMLSVGLVEAHWNGSWFGLCTSNGTHDWNLPRDVAPLVGRATCGAMGALHKAIPRMNSFDSVYASQLLPANAVECEEQTEHTDGQPPYVCHLRPGVRPVESCVASSFVQCDWDVPVRLEGGDREGVGQVMILNKGMWGTVCDRGFDEGAANAVCNVLGLRKPGDRPARPILNSAEVFGRMYARPVEGNMRCRGTERDLNSCYMRAFDDDQVNNDDLAIKTCRTVAGVDCSGDAEIMGPREGQVRLSGGKDERSGVVEVFHEDQWRAVCNSGDSFGQEEANVVCRQRFGEARGAKPGLSYSSRDQWKMWSIDFDCDGHEANFTACIARESWPMRDDDDLTGCEGRPATVVCAPQPGDVVLVDKHGSLSEKTSGFVNVWSNGTWREVLWSEAYNFAWRKGSNVFCQDAFPGTVMVSTTADEPSGPYMGDVNCTFADMRYPTLEQCSVGAEELFNDVMMGVVTVRCAQRVPMRLTMGGEADGGEGGGSGEGGEGGEGGGSGEGGMGMMSAGEGGAPTESKSNKGFLEVLRRGTWQPVCGGEVTPYAAASICRMLGFPATVHTSRRSLNPWNDFPQYRMRGDATPFPWISRAECPRQSDEDDNTATDDAQTDVTRLNIAGCEPSWVDLDETMEDDDDNPCNPSSYLGLFCEEQRPETNSVVLLGGHSMSEGIPHVVGADGSLMRVCGGDDGNDARVVCRQLGFDPARTLFGDNSYPHFLEDDAMAAAYEGQAGMFSCFGNETAITNCSSLPSDDGQCSYGPRFVECFPAMPEVVVRLSGSRVASQGVVSVWFDGEWRAPVFRDWTQATADVACRDLGFMSQTSRATFRPTNDRGLVSLPTITCEGDEAALEDCAWADTDSEGDDDAVDDDEAYDDDDGVDDDDGRAVHDDDAEGAIHHDDFDGSAVYLSCGVDEEYKPMVRLVGGATRQSGHIQVFHDNEWRLICDDGWGNREAAVICRQLGYSDGAAYGLQSVNGRWGFTVNYISRNFWLDEVDCYGTEEHLGQCKHSKWGAANCGAYSEPAGVFCTVPAPPDAAKPMSNITDASDMYNPVSLVMTPQGVFVAGMGGGLFELELQDEESGQATMTLLTNSSVMDAAAGLFAWNGKLWFLGQMVEGDNLGYFSFDLSLRTITMIASFPMMDAPMSYAVYDGSLFSSNIGGSAISRFNGTHFEVVVEGSQLGSLTVFRDELFFNSDGSIMAYSAADGQVRNLGDEVAGLQFRQIRTMVAEPDGASLFVIGQIAVNGPHVANVGIFQWVPGKSVEKVAELRPIGGNMPGSIVGVARDGALMVIGKYLDLAADDDDISSNDNGDEDFNDDRSPQYTHQMRSYLFLVRAGKETVELTPEGVKPQPVLFVSPEEAKVYFVGNTPEGVEIWGASFPPRDDSEHEHHDGSAPRRLAALPR